MRNIRVCGRWTNSSGSLNLGPMEHIYCGIVCLSTIREESTDFKITLWAFSYLELKRQQIILLNVSMGVCMCVFSVALAT